MRRTVTDALNAGFALSVDNGEELSAPTTKRKEILGAMMQCDEDRLYYHKDAELVGWVYFVYGNDGWDVISDYTTNLESFLKGADELSRRYEN
jgi:hypothetical protein